MDETLLDRTAIVTGAASGIGAATAQLFLEKSMQLVLVDSSMENLEQMVLEMNATSSNVQTVIGDVSKEEVCRRVVETAMERFGSIEVLVNSAGIIHREPTEETSLEAWNQVMATNLTAAFLMIKHVLPVMRAVRSGTVVNVASRAAKKPHPNASPSYGASKAGLIYLTRHIALEFAAHGITANAVCPGPVDTEMFQKIDSRRRQHITDQIPLGRAASPWEVAELILYLSSTSSHYITGEAVNINGGSLMD